MLDTLLPPPPAAGSALHEKALPKKSPQGHVQFEQWSPPHVGEGQYVILLDDSKDVLTLHEMVLRAAFACHVIPHTDPLKALADARALSKSHPSHSILFITDDCLGANASMEGRKVIETIRHEHLPVEPILFSGDEPLLLDMLKQGVRGAKKGAMGVVGEPENEHNRLNFFTTVYHAFVDQHAKKTHTAIPKRIMESQKAEREQLISSLTDEEALKQERIARYNRQPWGENGGLAAYEANDGAYMKLLQEKATERDVMHSAPMTREQGQASVRALKRGDVNLRADASTQTASPGADATGVTVKAGENTGWSAREKLRGLTDLQPAASPSREY